MSKQTHQIPVGKGGPKLPPNVSIPQKTRDNVNSPSHYQHPSGIECIDVAEHCNFCIGNAIKYLWRYQGKNGTEDLRKAIWYIEREITRLEKEALKVKTPASWVDSSPDTNKDLIHNMVFVTTDIHGKVIGRYVARAEPDIPDEEEPGNAFS